MKRRIAFDVGGRSVGPPSLGGAMANPTEDVIRYQNVISRAGQAMARFPRRPLRASSVSVSANHPNDQVSDRAAGVWVVRKDGD